MPNYRPQFETNYSAAYENDLTDKNYLENLEKIKNKDITEKNFKTVNNMAEVVEKYL